MTRLALAVFLVLLAACSNDAPDAPLAPPLSAALGASTQVTSSADDGAGSLRAALEAATADPSITNIQVAKGLGTVEIVTPLVWSGAQSLTIHGGGAIVDASGLASGESGLVADGGGDLGITDLTVAGAPTYGILVAVPDDASGIKTVTLDRVTVRGAGLHGVLINDQAEYLDNPASTSPDGSDASVAVRVTNSLFEDNGEGAVDYDGFRVNEGGEGSIDADFQGSRFLGNGADGLELDERGAGDARFSIQQSVLNANGFLSEVDPDDGIDVDEAGDGDIVARFVQVEANDNAEQGVDLNENDAGDLRVTMDQVEGSGNGAEGIEFEEDDDVAGGGDIIAELTGVVANGNGAIDGDAGLKIREKGAGDLLARLVNTTATGNLIGGIQIREASSGNIDARVQSASASNNATSGLELLGSGAVRVQNLTATGNPSGAIVADASVTVTEN